jgi:hypothetical protein
VSTLDEFVTECDRTAKALRRLPKDVRRALAADVKTQVAAPLAGKIAGAATGPYARALSGAVKARASAEPVIVVGGSRKVVSGGASPRDLIYGTEFGGGKRRSRVPGNGKHVGYSRAGTNQFHPARPFVFPTIGAESEWVLEQFADIVLKTLEQGLSDG